LPPARFDTALDVVDQLRGLSHALHPQWAQRLWEQTGIDTGFRRCGGIYLATSPGEAAALCGLAEYWDEYQITARAMRVDELVGREPALDQFARGGRMRAAWWLPDEAQLRPPDHLRALLAGCRQRGVRIMDHTAVREITVRSDGGVRVDYGQVVEPAFAVLCCGAWASRFATPLGRVDSVYPIRGQVVLYRARPGLLTAVINEGNRYLVPRDDGMIYVGSNEEEVGWETGTSDSVIDALRCWATAIVPDLKNYPVERTWSGLRPGSIDGFPFVGRAAGSNNLYVATGHYRSGLHLSCATATLLADFITGQPTPMSIAPLAPTR
jgi:glycine oxidase